MSLHFFSRLLDDLFALIIKKKKRKASKGCRLTLFLMVPRVVIFDKQFITGGHFFVFFPAFLF